jgi:hypothetical protein
MFGLRVYGNDGSGTRRVPSERTQLQNNRPNMSLEIYDPNWNRAVAQYTADVREIQQHSYAPFGWGEDARLKDGWPNADQCMPFDNPPQIHVKRPYLVPPTNWQ